MPPTKMKYGRKVPASHWIYKVLDLNKKHTRKYFMFEDEDVQKDLSRIRGTIIILCAQVNTQKMNMLNGMSMKQ